MAQSRPPNASNVVWQDYAVSQEDRIRLLGQRPFVLWFTGLSGAGKTTMANYLSKRLHDEGYHVFALDGDNLRHGLNGDLGFTAAARQENVRRMAELARLMYDAGLITLTACISPFQSQRDFARSLLPAGRFVEVFLDTPLDLCEERDRKGLYRRARAGEIADFTGIDSPYERPANAEVTLDTAGHSPAVCAEVIVGYLEGQGLLARPRDG